MSHRGDYDASAVVYGKFTTYRPSTGAPFTLAGSPALSVYKDNSTTQSTTGVTLTVDFDAVTGLNHFAIDTSADGTFYAAGSFFDIVITTGTVDGVSVVGAVVASFTIRKDSSLKPTTAARTLDVSAGGEAGIDWANVGSPTTAVNLSATNIDVDQVVASVSGAVGSVTGAVGSVTGNVGGNVTGSVGSVATGGIASGSFAAGAINAAAIAADAITAAKIADGAIDAATFAAGAINAAAIAADAITDAKVASDVTIASVTGAVGSVTGAVGSVTGNVGGNVTGSVGSVATGGIAAASFAAGAIDAAAIASDAFGALELAAGAASEIATAVRTELGTELGRIDAAVTTRASQTSLDTVDDFLDTEVAAIKAKTDNLPGDPADASDISSAFGTVNTTLGTIAGYLDTEIAAIKAKTDNLPAAPAATGDIPTATQNADALLNRDMSAVSDTNARSPLNALRFLRNKWDIAGTTLTVTKENDSTSAWTATVSTSAGADPVVGNDPA